MSSFVDRPLVAQLLARPDVPVHILEGARAVGKTTAMRRLSASSDFHYVSLAETGELEFASRDIEGWIERLPLPTIIDEAQLVGALPLAVKEHVDRLGPGTHIILTGSASIGRAGLGGADPLTRRSLRFTMSPVTDWEANSQPGSIVDALFDGHPIVGVVDTVSDDELLDRLSIGGFPAYRFAASGTTAGQRLDRIRADIASTFTDSVLPGLDVNAGIGRAVLDALLRTPGGIFNATRIAQTLELDRRTIDRYLGIFDRLFLTHWLPNLATKAVRQNHSRAKVHPVDTSFAVESFTRAGVDLLRHREEFGALVESYVVNQIVAATQWARIPTEQFYWRHASASSPEVDLVLVDGRGRAVGIEVKAARSVTPADLTGLREFAARRGLHRGFLFYAGERVRQLDDDIWALPFSVLQRAEVFGGTWSGTETESVTESGAGDPVERPDASDTRIVLGYLREDDERARGGMLRFARDLVDTYAYLYGRDLPLVADGGPTAPDSGGIRGARAVDGAILLAFVTPRYLRSEFCRAETSEFAEAGPGSLLTIPWIDVTGTDVVTMDDPVFRLLQEGSPLGVAEVRRVEPGSVEYDDLLERAARWLQKAIAGRGEVTRPRRS